MHTRSPLIQLYPYDLLHSIFQITVTSAKFRHRFAVATRLSHVCRHWRDNALLCPTIWSHITFYVRRIDSVSSLARAVASRTSNVPVEIRVDYQGAYGFQLRPSLGALNHCLLDTFSVIRMLEFRFDESIDEPWENVYNSKDRSNNINLLDIVKGDTRLPRDSIDTLSIRLNRSQGDSPCYFINVNEFISKFPSIQSLLLNTGKRIWFRDPQDWSSLQKLIVHRQSLTSTMLIVAPNLVALHVSSIRFSGSNWLSPISLPKLQSLRIEHLSYCEFQNIVHCPNLRNANLKLTEHYSWHPFTISSKLNHLVILTLDVDSDGFYDIVPILPQIRFLSLFTEYSDYLLTNFFDWAEWRLEGPPFPALEELTVHFSEDDHRKFLVPSHLENFVRNRLLPRGHPNYGTVSTDTRIQKLTIIEDVKANHDWLTSPCLSSLDIKQSETNSLRTVSIKCPNDL